MAIALRLCLYDCSGDNLEFRKAFTGFEGVNLWGTCTRWNELQQHVHLGSLDAVAVNLDGSPENPRFLTVQRLSELAPDLAIIGVSVSTDPNDIIAAMRAGCSQFVKAPIDRADLLTALNRVRKRQPAQSETHSCQQIAVIGSSGGAGATTTACNLALELANQTGRRIGLVDLDLQFGDIACMFDRTPKFSITDLCRSGQEIDRTLLESALDALPCNLSLLACPERLEDGSDVSPDCIEELFHCLAQMFPFVVVDVPRVLTPMTMRSLQTSDKVLVVSQLAVPFLRNARRLLQVLRAGVEETRVELVLNRCNADHERIKPAEAEKHFGRPVFAVIPNDYKHVTASRDLGHPISASAPNSPARLAIQKLARNLAAAFVSRHETITDGGGLFGLFRRKRVQV